MIVHYHTMIKIYDCKIDFKLRISQMTCGGRVHLSGREGVGFDPKPHHTKRSYTIQSMIQHVPEPDASLSDRLTITNQNFLLYLV